MATFVQAFIYMKFGISWADMLIFDVTFYIRHELCDECFNAWTLTVQIWIPVERHLIYCLD